MKKSYWIAGAVVLVTALWMLSGQLEGEGSGESPESGTATQRSAAPMAVETRWMQAEEITSFLVVQGQLQPDRSVVLRAEVSGQVEAVLAREGSVLTQGDPILQLKMDDREIRREQAELKIEEKQRQVEAVTGLQGRGFSSQTELDTARVELKMAEVELAQIMLEIERTTLRAPFDGLIEERLVEVGDFVSVGNELVSLVNNSPLLVVVRVPQRSIHYVVEDEKVRIRLVDGTEREGRVRFVSSRGDEATRTFRVDIEVPNPEGLRAGSSATAYIPKADIMAHFISGAMLSLSESGEMGVKTVDPEGRVEFYPVNVELSEAQGMWVSGLPARARVITNGQGFVRVGEPVVAVDTEELGTAVRKQKDKSYERPD